MSLNPIIESVIDEISTVDIKLTLDEAFHEVMSKYDSRGPKKPEEPKKSEEPKNLKEPKNPKEPIKRPGIVAKRAPETLPPIPADDEETRDAAESRTYLDRPQVSTDVQTVSDETNQADGQCSEAADDGQPPEKKKKIQCKVCYAPLCPCTSRTCTIQTSQGTKGQKYNYWKRFLQLYDPSADVEELCNRRKDRRITLCCCHFDDEDNLVIPPVLTKTIKELKKKGDEMDKLNRALNEIMTKDQIDRLITDSLRKRKQMDTGTSAKEGVNGGADDGTNDATDENIEIKKTKSNGKRYSHESLLKCLEMFEKLGGPKYEYLISLNWPLASMTSVSRFKRQFKSAIAYDT